MSLKYIFIYSIYTNRYNLPVKHEGRSPPELLFLVYKYYRDGIVYIWDQDTGEVLQKLKGHSGMVYNAVWNNKQSLFVSCSDDKTLKTWWYDENVSLEL